MCVCCRCECLVVGTGTQYCTNWLSFEAVTGRLLVTADCGVCRRPRGRFFRLVVCAHLVVVVVVVHAALDEPIGGVDGQRHTADDESAGAERHGGASDQRQRDQFGAEQRAAYETPSQRPLRVEAIAAAEHAQLAVVVADELEVAEAGAALVAELGATAGAEHVIAALVALDQYATLGTVLGIGLAVVGLARPALQLLVALGVVGARKRRVPGRVTPEAPRELALAALDTPRCCLVVLILLLLRLLLLHHLRSCRLLM